VSDDDRSVPDDASPGNGAIPKLTIGQRVLASLPNLQRPTTTPPPRPGRTTRRDDAGDGATATSNGTGTGTVVTPDEVLAPDAETSPSRGRLLDTFTKPPEPRPQRGAPSGMTKEELTHIIKRLDDRERLLAFFAAPLGAVVGILLTVIAVHTNPALHHKNHASTSLIVFEGGARVVFAGAVALAAWTRRRSFVAFALLFLGTSMAAGILFALPFWALGVWLIFRVLKWQKELATMTGGQSRARTGPADRGRDAAGARRDARADRARARTTGGRHTKKKPEPAGPSRNKRYTPPNTVKPRPPGSSA
jgi:hypothetical protein